MFPVKLRKLLLVGLLIAWGTQGMLVYLDSTGEKWQLENPSAINGRNIWMKNNCQSCHQIYGYGGFLGPDLTNIEQKYEADELLDLLEAGPGQMPSIKITLNEAKDLKEYLSVLNSSGIGQLRPINNKNIYNGLMNLPWFEYKE